MLGCFEILLISFDIISLQPAKPSLCSKIGLLEPNSLNSCVYNKDFVFVSFYGACSLMLTILRPQCINNPMKLECPELGHHLHNQFQNISITILMPFKSTRSVHSGSGESSRRAALDSESGLLFQKDFG